ncbi:hypothetical protein QQ045_026990 [Rhodiola kirilowii]
MLKRKAKMDWVKQGDQNSKLFHAAIKVRTNTNRMNLELEDGSVTNNKDIIWQAAATFYKTLFQGHTPPNPSSFAGVPRIITPSDNIKLNTLPTEQEVQAVIHEMNPKSSPGLDGFSGRFYIDCWNIIKDDLMLAIHFLLWHLAPHQHLGHCPGPHPQS